MSDGVHSYSYKTITFYIYQTYFIALYYILLLLFIHFAHSIIQMSNHPSLHFAFMNPRIFIQAKAIPERKERRSLLEEVRGA